MPAAPVDPFTHPFDTNTSQLCWKYTPYIDRFFYANEITNLGAGSTLYVNACESKKGPISIQLAEFGAPLHCTFGMQKAEQKPGAQPVDPSKRTMELSVDKQHGQLLQFLEKLDERNRTEILARPKLFDGTPVSEDIDAKTARLLSLKSYVPALRPMQIRNKKTGIDRTPGQYPPTIKLQLTIFDQDEVNRLKAIAEASRDPAKILAHELYVKNLAKRAVEVYRVVHYDPVTQKAEVQLGSWKDIDVASNPENCHFDVVPDVKFNGLFKTGAGFGPSFKGKRLYVSKNNRNESKPESADGTQIIVSAPKHERAEIPFPGPNDPLTPNPKKMRPDDSAVDYADIRYDDSDEGIDYHSVSLQV